MEKQIQKLLKSLKLNESTISMVLGLGVVVVVGGLLVNYFRMKPVELPDSTNGLNQPQITDEAAKDEYANTPAAKLPPFTGDLPTKYKVRAGDDLWHIAERYYKSGYAWVEIASANSLDVKTASSLEKDREMTIPLLEKTYKATVEENQPTIGGAATDSAMIAERPTDAPTPTVTMVPTVTVAATATPTVTATPTSMPTPTVTVQPTQAPMVTTAPTQAAPAANPISGDRYTIQTGDHLWGIAVRAYGDGYKWVEIARANKLENPNLIFSGNELTLPR